MKEAVATSELPSWDEADQEAAYDRFVDRLAGSHEFLDHAGRESVSFYIGQAASKGKAVLPPLWSYQVYAAYEQADLFAVAQAVCELTRASQADLFSFRVDVYGVGKASLQECMQAYEKEKASRVHTAQAIPNHKTLPHYLVYLDTPSWRTSLITVIAWDDRGRSYRQDDVMANIRSSVYAGDDGFVLAAGERGNLGDALMSLYPERCEDEDYVVALYYGKESWDPDLPYDRDPELEFGA